MDFALQALRQFMHQRAGVYLGPEKTYLFHTRLQPVLQSARLPDLPALVSALQAQPHGVLAQDVLSALTTHETSWFRDVRPFERLRKEVLPLWRQAERRSLRLWSAACSTGQEAYSLAMLLAEEGLLPPAWSWELLASDLCDSVLAQARAGRYSDLEMARGLPPDLRARYFRALGSGAGEWEILPELAQRVQFRAINLVELAPAVPTYDLIFCRNVLIYFDRTTQQAVLQALHSRLLPGGLLFLGASESPLGLCPGLQAWGSGSGVYVRAGN